MFNEYSLGKSLTDLGAAVSKIARDFEGVDLADENVVRFRRELIPYIESHTWTIRFKPNVIRWPCNKFGSPRNKLYVHVPNEEGEWINAGIIYIPKMVVGHVKDWPADHEAIFGSGWDSKNHMVKGISDIYEPIYGQRLTENDILVGYALEGFKWDQGFPNGISGNL